MKKRRKNWIPVSITLPQDSNLVDVKCVNENNAEHIIITKARYINNDWEPEEVIFTLGSSLDVKVTHWK